MSNMIDICALRVAEPLYVLVRDEIAPGTGIEPEHFWAGLGRIVQDLAPKNRVILQKRDRLQKQIDDWHRSHNGARAQAEESKAFLEEIGYLIPEGEAFEVGTSMVDAEIATMAGPQLVVPVDNPRYAINAANARWGSLYDALYGTNLISHDSGLQTGRSYNPARGAAVIARSEAVLDEIIGLDQGKFPDIKKFSLKESRGKAQLVATLHNGRTVGLADPEKFVGFLETDGNLIAVLLKNNNLHIEIKIDRDHDVGRSHPAGVNDIIVEAALTTIQDCEDSVAAVDADDKVNVYRNWMGLMKGTLEACFEKNGRSITRRLHPDKTFKSPDGNTLTLPGRSLLLIRNVGLHMYTDAVTTANGEEIPESFLDAMVTSLGALHDLNRTGAITNSKSGSIYIVKPKFHGPDEVGATVELFRRVEEVLKVDPCTLKIGIMDEERRTTVNLKEAIRTAKDRVVFINTGFLDRTGDEIHTSMEAGAMLPKMEIKSQPWMQAYEDWNVDVGIETGLPGRAQIGKGMWVMPDEMKEMFASKMSHPQAGASTAWVPSPTAAVLHALHYHQVNVRETQSALSHRQRARLEDILSPPLLDRSLKPSEIQQELDNNAQGILGYIVRWVDQGIGCSKVPDIRDVGLMEDRATLRISSQHMTNWLHHGIVNESQLVDTFKRMAAIVDAQNTSDENYRNMAGDYDGSTAFQAALELVLTGRTTPNGYTEPVLHARRREVKRRNATAICP